MADIKKCDRCFTIYNPNESNVKNDEKILYDLCDECLTKHAFFMQNREEMVLLDPSKTACRDCGRRIASANTTNNEVNYCTAFDCVKFDHERICKFFKFKD